MYNGIPLPKKYVDELIKRGIIKPPKTSEDTVTPVSVKSTKGPHQIDGKIYVKIFIAKDKAHRPDMSFSELESKN